MCVCVREDRGWGYVIHDHVQRRYGHTKTHHVDVCVSVFVCRETAARRGWKERHRDRSLTGTLSRTKICFIVPNYSVLYLAYDLYGLALYHYLVCMCVCVLSTDIGVLCSTTCSNTMRFIWVVGGLVVTKGKDLQWHTYLFPLRLRCWSVDYTIPYLIIIGKYTINDHQFLTAIGYYILCIV